MPRTARGDDAAHRSLLAPLFAAPRAEGVYVGSANDYSDRSDHVQILDNTIGPLVRGENVDVKEGRRAGGSRTTRSSATGSRARTTTTRGST